MPFFKRAVEPHALCTSRVPDGLFEDLDSVSNMALSRSLRQLADLARHACSMFHELEDEVTSTSVRLLGLQARLSSVQKSCTELEPRREAVREYL